MRQARQMVAGTGRPKRPPFLAKLAVAGMVALGVLGLLPFASAAQAKIIPGVGIAGVKLFDGYGPVRQSLGYPERTIAKSGKYYGVGTWWYRNKPLKGVVKFIDVNVHSIITRSKHQATSRGIGPGSSYAATFAAYPEAECRKKHVAMATCILIGTFQGEKVRTKFVFLNERMLQAEVTELSDHISK
jgi:hypothetical protein